MVMFKNVRIAAPCPAEWERMSGDERTRHCTLCDLNVYNFAAMTGDEVRELLERSEGRVCARLYQRADGTLITKDCPSGHRNRFSRSMSAMMAALLSITTLVSGCATRSKSKVQIEIEQVTTPQSAIFAGIVVFHNDETPLPGVTVKVRDESLGRERTTVTDANGAFAIPSLPEGRYRVEASLAGLEPVVLKHVALKQSQIARARVTLRLDAVTSVIVGAIAVDETMTNSGMSTTFSQELINKLPLSK